METAVKKFHTQTRVYWCDCDAAGIAFYGNFFRWFEQAEEDLYGSLGRSRSDIFKEVQVGFPRVDVWCRYRKPARLGDLLDTAIWIEKRTRSSMTFRIEMRRAGEQDLVCEATSRVVCVNRQFQVSAIPQKIEQLLADYLPPVSVYAGAD